MSGRQLVPLYMECNDGPCPKVYADEDGSISAQGALIEDQDVLDVTTPGGHERVVRIPRRFLIEASRALEEGT